MKRLVADPGHVDSILIDGADRARAIAAETMKATKDIVGFVADPSPPGAAKLTQRDAAVEDGCAVAACGLPGAASGHA